MQRISRFFLIFSLSFLVGGGLLFVSYTQASGNLFTRSLRLGLFGEDVRLLQKILNTDPSTRIQESGLGSPGQETAYFGALTSAAVARFQEKYKNEILIPNSLISGTGFVGVSTLAVLNNFAQNKQYETQTPVSATVSSLKSGVINDQSSTNPNLKNLDIFLATVEKEAQKKGKSAGEISHIKKVIIADVATSTNLLKKFESTVNKKVSFLPPSFSNTLARIIKSFKTSIFPKNVQAATGLPFGGEILFSYYCSCSQNWLIYIKPAISPTMPTMLSYTTGSQAFLNYNLPFALLILGNYEPGAGFCISEPEADCGVDIPSEGLITPMVGSL